MKKIIAHITFILFFVSAAAFGQTELFPNVFTPNNDDKNDVFQTTNKHITDIDCLIYNRWGNLVYELTKPSQVWDGRTSAGVECSTGVYYYVVFAISESGEYINEKGFVQLIK